MANLAKTAIFTIAEQKRETALEKTTRIVRKINDAEAEIRHVKTARLRKARFESEAGTDDESPAKTSRKSQQEAPIKKVV